MPQSAIKNLRKIMPSFSSVHYQTIDVHNSQLRFQLSHQSPYATHPHFCLILSLIWLLGLLCFPCLVALTPFRAAFTRIV